MKKYSYTETHQDIWEHASEPYQANDKEIYIKLEIDPEAKDKILTELRKTRNIGIMSALKKAEGEDGGDDLPEEMKDHDDDHGHDGHPTTRSTERLPLPGERERTAPFLDNILIACSPYPTNKPHAVLPRYLTRLKHIDPKNPSPVFDHVYKGYFEGVQYKLVGDLEK